MAILTPDKTSTLNGVKVNEYLLTKHNPKKIDMPTAALTNVIGVTIHNTDWINTASNTTPAEQYTRATVNGNMKTVRIHYYVDHKCAWQNLPLTLSGWHAADGSGNGNRKTVSIECIMSSKYNANDQASEDNAARLCAYLLNKYKLSIDHLYTHTHWLNVRDGKTGTTEYLNTAKNSYKNCPAYILPHWAAFKAKVQKYMGTTTTVTTEAAKTTTTTSTATTTAASKTLTKGTKVTLTKANLYASATAKSASSQKTGTFYIYDGTVTSGRVRITTKADFVGKTPAGSYVTGWVNKSDCK